MVMRNRRLQHILLWGWVIIGMSIMCGSAVAEETAQLHLTPSEKAFLKTQPLIRVPLIDHQPPLTFVKDDVPMGYLNDLWERVATMLEINVKRIHGLTYETSLQALERHEVDLLNNYSHVAGRDFVLPTKPVLTVPFVAVGGVDQPAIRTIQDLQDKRLVLVSGFLQTRTIQQRYPNLNIRLVNGIDEAYRALRADDADYYIDNVVHAGYYLRQKMVSDLEIRGELPPEEMGELEFRFGIRADLPLLHSAVEKALAAIPETEWEKLRTAFRSHLDHPESRPVLTDTEQAWLASHPQIVFGCDKGWAPYVIPQDSGTVVGVEADLIAKINQLTGANITIQLGNWADIVEKAKRRQIDGLALSTYHKEHEAYFRFTNSLYSVYKYIYCREGNRALFNTMDDLTGKRVAVLKGNRAEEKLLESIPGVIPVPVEQTEHILPLLLNGGVDAAIGGLNLYMSALEQMVSTIDIAFVIPEREVKILYSIRKDWPELQSIINKALNEISLQERNAILEKWGAHFPDILHLKEMELSPQEKDWRLAHPVVRVGVPSNMPPMAYIDSNGQPVGLFFDYLQLFTERLGIHFEPVQLAWPDILTAIQNGEIDLFFGFESPDRNKYCHFTEGLFRLQYVIIMPQHTPFIQGIKSLHGKRVSVVQDVKIHHYLEHNHPEIELVPAKSVSQALQTVALGRADAYVGETLTAAYAINRERIINLKIAAPANHTDEWMRLGIRPDWQPLITLLNKTIRSISPEERDELLNKWMTIRYEQTVNWRIVWTWLSITAGVMGMIILITLFWNRRLAREIRVRRQIEEKLELAKEAAETANKTKSEFLTHMSHELRTPLNAILGFSQILKIQPNLSAEQQRYLEIIFNSGKHLLSLIEDILDMSKIEAQKLKLHPITFDLRQTVYFVYNINKISAEKKDVIMVLESHTPLPEAVYGDEQKVKQVLINLTNNAVKYTTQGQIILRTDYDPETERFRFEVNDTGAGIPEHRLNDIFKPFTQLHQGGRYQTGTGLGLAITQKLIELMNGTITVESTAGKGSCFRITLPLPLSTEKTVLRQFGDYPLITGYEGEKRHVLVIDDNPTNGALLQTLLTPLGFSVELAENGKVGLECVRHKLPDIILLDRVMAVMDGVTFIKHLRKEDAYQHIPIVGISASTTSQEDQPDFIHMCDEFLPKPIEHEKLLKVIGTRLHLKWKLKEQPPESTRNASPMTFSIPPSPILNAIEDATTLGDYDQIEMIIEKQLTSNPQYDKVFKRLKKLIRRYDSRGILEYLAELKAKEPPDG